MKGSFESRDASIHLELAVLDEWRDEEFPHHVRLKLDELAVNYRSDDD